MTNATTRLLPSPKFSLGSAEVLSSRSGSSRVPQVPLATVVLLKCERESNALACTGHVRVAKAATCERRIFPKSAGVEGASGEEPITEAGGCLADRPDEAAAETGVSGGSGRAGEAELLRPGSGYRLASCALYGPLAFAWARGSCFRAWGGG